jgi:hypothetical protein
MSSKLDNHTCGMCIFHNYKSQYVYEPLLVLAEGIDIGEYVEKHST